MKKRLASIALAASVLGGSAVLVPTVAFAQDAEEQEAAADWLGEALAPLVEAGTLTQVQADAVADALEEARPAGHRGPGRGFRSLDTAAEVIGIEEDALRDALAEGQTLAEVAEANDVDVRVLIAALVEEHNARIDQGVADGNIDPDDAADMKADVAQHVTDMVNGERPAGGPRFGPRPGAGEGFGPFGAPDGEDASLES